MNKYLVAVFSVLHLLPHAAGISPIGAIAIYAGAVGNRKTAWLAPLIPMLIRDIYVGFYDIRTMVSVYVGMVSSVWIGQAILSHKRTLSRYLSAYIAGAVAFYLVANCASWYVEMQTPTVADILTYYQNGLPYLVIGILANIGFGTAMFALHSWLLRGAPRGDAIAR